MIRSYTASSQPLDDLSGAPFSSTIFMYEEFLVDRKVPFLISRRLSNLLHNVGALPSYVHHIIACVRPHCGCRPKAQVESPFLYQGFSNGSFLKFLSLNRNLCHAVRPSDFFGHHGISVVVVRGDYRIYCISTSPPLVHH